VPGPQVLLALALIGIYVLDSAHFLSIGDAVLVTGRGRLRQVSFGWSFELAGRRPYVPNPLTPFWPDLRIQWSASALGTSEPGVATSEMLEFVAATRLISRMAGLAGLFIVFCAPVVLVVGSEPLFLVCVIVSFALTLSACCTLALRRKEMALGWSSVISLSFVALLCLPCAANLGRALSRHRCWTLAAANIPALGFSSAKRGEIERRVAAFLSEIRRLFPEDASEYRALTNQIAQLEGHVLENR
jgi:hypothetical protein